MANEKEKVEKVEVAKNPKPKEGIINLYQTKELVATDKAPYHKKGEKIKASKTLAAKMIANGWAEEAD